MGWGRAGLLNSQGVQADAATNVQVQGEVGRAEQGRRVGREWVGQGGEAWKGQGEAGWSKAGLGGWAKAG